MYTDEEAKVVAAVWGTEKWTLGGMDVSTFMTKCPNTSSIIQLA